MTEQAASYYRATAAVAPSRPPLDGSARADVCVIGGGYTGLSTAIDLAGRGFNVILIEARSVGFGASGRNGGHVGIGQRKDQDELEAMCGRSDAKRLWQYSLDAVDRVERLIREHEIDCDLKRGTLHLAAKRAHVDEYRDHVRKLRDEYDFHELDFVGEDEARIMVGSQRYYGGVVDSRSLHLHPLNYALGLARAAEKFGVVIHESTRALSCSLTDPAVVTTDRGEIRARFVVYACNGYLGKLNRRMAANIMPINNFMLATEPFDRNRAREIIRDDVAVSDSLFVVNYWKLSGDDRLLFGGGENYRRGFPEDIAGFVRKFMLKVYPQLHDARIDYAWGGTLAITLKRMPDFGRLAANVYYAQGYSGHGIAAATFAGEVIAEAVAGTAERFDLFERLPVQKFPGGTMLRWPGLVLGMLYYAIKDRL